MNRKKVLLIICIITALIVLLILFIDGGKRYKKLTISEEKWNDIISQRQEDESLTIDEITFNDYKLMLDKDSDTIYYSVIEDNISKFNPRVKYQSNDDIKIAFLNEEITDKKIDNNHHFKMIVYNKEKYHVYNMVFTDLPILSITLLKESKEKQANVPMEIYLYDNNGNNSRIVISNGEVSIGENSITFRLSQRSPGKNKRDNDISILGMDPDSTYTLKKEEDESGREVLLFIGNELYGKYFLTNK